MQRAVEVGLAPAPALLRCAITLLSRFLRVSARLRKTTLLLVLPALAPAPAAWAQSSLLSAPVPHRFLVAYRNNTIPGDAETRMIALHSQVLTRHDRFGITLVQSASDVDDTVTLARLRAQPNVEYAVHDRIVRAHQLTLAPAQRIFQAPATSAVPSAATVAPFDTAYSSSTQGWAIRQVGGYGFGVPGGPAYGPWDISMGQGIRIAILDSGVDATHPDLAPNLALNLSEVDQSPQTGLPSACDDGSPQDQQGHGTWTASLAAAALGPGTGQIIGVAPAATLLNIKVLERLADPAVTSASVATQCATGQAGGLLSWVIQGIEDAVANHADVVSLSLGSLIDLETGEGAGLKATFDRVTYAATQAGTILVAAAGNDGFDLSNQRYMELPAQAHGVLAIVGSTNPACAENLTAGAVCNPGPITRAYYSNFGAPLNTLAAPGGSMPDGATAGVASGWIRGACSAGIPGTQDGAPDATHSLGCFNLGHTQYVEAMGTSASAALAAGVAALYRGAHPAWSAA
jgi:subtilisin family serine protease